MKTGRRQADQHIAGAHSGAIEDRPPLHGADDETHQLVVARPVEAGHLRGLSPEKRATVVDTRVRHAPKQGRHGLSIQLARTDVVEKEQRRRALHQNVIDTVIHEIGADGAEIAGHSSYRQLGANAVRRSHKHGRPQRIGQGEQAPEGSWPAQYTLGECRLHQTADAGQGLVLSRQIHSRVPVGVCFLH